MLISNFWQLYLENRIIENPSSSLYCWTASWEPVSDYASTLLRDKLTMVHVMKVGIVNGLFSKPMISHNTSVYVHWGYIALPFLPVIIINSGKDSSGEILVE